MGQTASEEQQEGEMTSIEPDEIRQTGRSTKQLIRAHELGCDYFVVPFDSNVGYYRALQLHVIGKCSNKYIVPLSRICSKLRSARNLKIMVDHSCRLVGNRDLLNELDLIADVCKVEVYE